MRKRQAVLVLIVCGSAFFMQGCTAVLLVGAGAGTVAYLKGDLNAVMSEDVGHIYAATLKALDELEIATTRRQKDALSAVIVGRTIEDKKITIKLKSTEDKLTKLSIRIGMFGNESMSRAIYEQIKKNI